MLNGVRDPSARRLRFRARERRARAPSDATDPPREPTRAHAPCPRTAPRRPKRPRAPDRAALLYGLIEVGSSPNARSGVRPFRPTRKCPRAGVHSTSAAQPGKTESISICVGCASLATEFDPISCAVGALLAQDVGVPSGRAFPKFCTGGAVSEEAQLLKTMAEPLNGWGLLPIRCRAWARVVPRLARGEGARTRT